MIIYLKIGNQFLCISLTTLKTIDIDQSISHAVYCNYISQQFTFTISHPQFVNVPGIKFNNQCKLESAQGWIAQPAATRGGMSRRGERVWIG